MLLPYQVGFHTGYVILVCLVAFNCRVSFEPYYTHDVKWADLPFCVMFLCFCFTCSQVLFVSEGLHLRAWAYCCLGLCSTSISGGSTCAISVVSTCALNNLHIDTVGYSLAGLPPPSGGCSCVGFIFYDFFFFFFWLLFIPLQNHVLLLTREVRRSRRLFHLGALWSQRTLSVHSSRLSEPVLT